MQIDSNFTKWGHSTVCCRGTLLPYHTFDGFAPLDGNDINTCCLYRNELYRVGFGGRGYLSTLYVIDRYGVTCGTADGYLVVARRQGRFDVCLWGGNARRLHWLEMGFQCDVSVHQQCAAGVAVAIAPCYE